MSKLAVLLLIIFALGASFIFGFQTHNVITNPEEKITFPVLSNGTYEVGRVIDGDTIELINGIIIRYEGIDAPEQSKPSGKAATIRNEELVLGETVRIEIAEDRKDLYGRTLAYVWLDDVMINELLVKEGLATPYFPAKHKKPKYWNTLETADKLAKERTRVDE